MWFFHMEKNNKHKCLAYIWRKMTKTARVWLFIERKMRIASVWLLHGKKMANTRSVWLLYEKTDKHKKSSPNDILFITSKIQTGFLNL